uniref:Uncharacterized protein n=1 Tax=Anguilla anguilla TaxID=7936 RepID=A0A0E9RQ98_ANGAN
MRPDLVVAQCGGSLEPVCSEVSCCKVLKSVT